MPTWATFVHNMAMVITEAGRLVTSLDVLDDLFDGLLAPFAAPASVLHVSNPDAGKLMDKFATEKATARVA